MKTRFLVGIFAVSFFLYDCSDEQSKRVNLSAMDFANKANELHTAPIIDVRTSDEFSKGHLLNAKMWIGTAMILINKWLHLINPNPYLFIV